MSKNYIFYFLCSFIFVGINSAVGNSAYQPPAGSVIEVNVELGTTAGIRVIIQQGRVVRRQDIVPSSPYCFFTVERSQAQMQYPIVIERGLFTITSTNRRRDWAMSEGVQYAGRGHSARNLTTVMEIVSYSQPEITHLACTRLGTIFEDGWLNLADMRAVLNGAVTISLPDQ